MAAPYDNAANQAAIAAAGAIVPLVALVTNGAAGGQRQAERALRNLACKAANRVAIAEAGGIAISEAGEAAIAEAASRVQILKAENESLAAENERPRARIEEVDERHERPRQRARIEAAQ